MIFVNKCVLVRTACFGEKQIMARKKVQRDVPGTKITFLGGVNEDRIGGNASVIEHVNEEGKVSRVMFDLGAMFAPYESGFESAYPNAVEYFDRVNPENNQETKALKPVDMLFVTHAHEDHIGALVNYVKMGFQLPPIKTSRFTKNLINIVFAQNGVKAPVVETIKPGDNIPVGDDMVIEPFVVSHSTLESMGFHTLTFVDGKPHAGVLSFGDVLTDEKMPLGAAYQSEQVADLLRRKLTTTVLVDSTSVVPNGKARLGFDRAVENTVEVIRRNPDRDVIISPVISRSFQNIAVDAAAARESGAKICLEGTWLKLVYKAMQLSGYKDFDDVMYKGDLKQFLNDKKIARKYVVCTGAFAQGLQEYNNNQGQVGLNNIPMAAATKMALGLHRDMQIGKNVLVLARQRVIEDINGQTGPEMLQLLASRGAKVVMTPGARKIANFEEVPMQDSGHMNAEAFAALVQQISKYAPDAVYVPIHGNPGQCDNVAEVARQQGARAFLTANSEVLSISRGEIEARSEDKPFTWIAVKKIYPNPLQPDESVPPEGKEEFWVVDEYYQPVEDKPFYDTGVVKSYKPGEKEYYANQSELFDDRDEGYFHESNRERKVKLSRKEKKRSGAEERKAALEQKARRYKINHRTRNAEDGGIMTYFDANGVERVKTTKSGKPRAINRFTRNNGR